MTNFEKNEDKLKEIFCRGYGIDKRLGNFRSCIFFSCDKCKFGEGCESCTIAKRKWLEEEYVEPPVDWSKVAVDTPILVRDCLEGNWAKRHFAKYENGKVYAFGNGATSWSDPTYTNKWNYAKLAKQR